MYQCQNCGGQLKFSIEDQQLKCDYCSSLYNPYEVEKESDGYETDFFEAKYFACPQCGGEIFTTDETSAGFCSYCGASTILNERLVQQKKFDGVIPFKISKEKCKGIFVKHIKSAWFVPKNYIGSNSIEGFRGIYMPYWLYTTAENETVNVPMETSHREGDYIITDHYNANIDIKSKFEGFYYDASSSFYDNISVPLAPYNTKNMVGFTPSYLSGFYADLQDVHMDVYKNDAVNDSIESTCDMIKKIPEIKKYTIDNEKLKKSLHVGCNNTMAVYMPVWFMSYRMKNRVAYATVNGETGKVVADLPVSPIKYLLGSLLLSLPIYFLLNWLFVCTALVTLSTSLVLTMLSAIVCVSEISAINKKEKNEGDKGIEYKKTKKDKTKSVVKKSGGGMNAGGILLLSAILAFLGLLLVKEFYDKAWIVAGIVIVITKLCMPKKDKEMKAPVKGRWSINLSVVASIITAAIFLTHPVEDFVYYTGAFIAVVATVINFIAIIRNYSILGTRYLPTFDHKGGDDLA